MKKIIPLIFCFFAIIFFTKNIIASDLQLNTYSILIENQPIVENLKNLEDAINQAKTINNSSVTINGILLQNDIPLYEIDEKEFDYGYFEVFQNELLLEKFTSYKLAHDYALNWSNNRIIGKIKVWENTSKYKVVPKKNKIIIPEIKFIFKDTGFKSIIEKKAENILKYKVYQNQYIIGEFKTKEEAIIHCDKYSNSYITFVGKIFSYQNNETEGVFLEKSLIDFGIFEIYNGKNLVSNTKSMKDAIDLCKNNMEIIGEILVYTKAPENINPIDYLSVANFDDPQKAIEFINNEKENMILVATTNDKYKIGTIVYDKELKIGDENRNTKISLLNETISSYGDGVSVYYKNIQTGYEYKYNENKVFFSASIIKAPYSLYVYEKAKKENIDLNKTHKYTSNLYRGGSGIIRNMSVKDYFSENDLLKYTIRESDNIAFRMLINEYGIDEFKYYLNDKGLDSSKIDTITNARVNAIDVMNYATIIYDFISKDGLLENQFKLDLMSTSTPIITSNYPIAHKYGQWTLSFHDMGIVYSSSPYILVVLSNKENATAKDYAMFENISTNIEGFNESEFVK